MRRTMGMITVILLLVTGAAYVAADSDQALARKLSESGEIMPLEQVLAGHESTAAGPILEVELEQEGKQVIYEIELLDSEGKVWELEVDAVTGKLLKRELDD